MKKSWIILISLILICIISITTYEVHKNSYTSKIRSINVENISSIGIQPESGIINNENATYLDLINSKDTVNNIINWINSGSIVGDAKDEMISDGGSPTYLVIKLKDGTSIMIKSAIGSITTKLPNGTKVDGQNIEGQVTIEISGKQIPIREYSPQLKSFIESGWKSVLNGNILRNG